MAYKICQFVANYSLTGIPADRVFSPLNNNSSLLTFPENKDVLIKKIAVDAVYNSPGEICVLDYSLCLTFIHRNNTIIRPNPARFINNGIFVNQNQILCYLNKQNPIINENFIAGGFFLGVGANGNLIKLSNTGVISSNISFLITIYYEEN